MQEVHLGSQRGRATSGDPNTSGRLNLRQECLETMGTRGGAGSVLQRVRWCPLLLHGHIAARRPVPDRGGKRPPHAGYKGEREAFLSRL